MKISMWILHSELAKKYETLPLIEDGSMELKSVRLFLDEEIPQSSLGYVYVGKTDSFFHDLSYPIILASGRDIMFVAHDDILEIVHEVLAIYDKYQNFEEALREAGYSADPFQDMLDVIHAQFQCPMFCGQKDLRIFALTKQYTDEQVYDGWQEVVKYFTMPLTIINSTADKPNMDDYPETIKTVAIPVSEQEGKHFRYQIRSLIYCRGIIWGHLYIYFYEPTVPVSVLQLAGYCADMYGRLLDRIVAADRGGQHKKYTYLVDLLDGKTVEKACIENLKWQKNWSGKQKLRLFRIAMLREQFREVFFEYIYELIDAAAQSEIVFPYKEDIIIIAKADGDDVRSLLESSKRVMGEDQYVCGVSYPFTQIEFVAYAYFQAGFAVEKYFHDQPEDNIIFYDDYAFAGVLTYISNVIEYRAFIAPELLQLYEIDETTGTEYYRTLFWLLSSNYHASEAARTLYIHRNTLKYRIDKIIQITKLDIYDVEVGTYLRFCYALMLKDFPLSRGNRSSAADAQAELPGAQSELPD